MLSGGWDGHASTHTASSARHRIEEGYFSLPADGVEAGDGDLRAFVPGGLRTSAQQAPFRLLYRSPYTYEGGTGTAMDNSDDALLSGVRGGPEGGPAPSTTKSVMSPIFHFTSRDTTLVAMEHNNHCKLLALSTSKNEIYVTLTQVMPVVEDALSAINQNGVTLDERLQDWDPAAMSVLVDRLPFPCTQLRWAPWQHGVYLAGICPGRQVRVYRFSHGRWALDATLTEPADTLAFAFSAQFTLACACRGGRIALLMRRATSGEEKAWVVTHRFAQVAAPSARPSRRSLTLGASAADPNAGAPRGRGGGATGGAPQLSAGTVAAAADRVGDFASVDFDESGSLLAVIDHHACVRVYGLAHDASTVSHLAFVKDSVAGRRSGGGGGDAGIFARSFRQVAWSPSAGRSFLILAVVLPNRILLWLFRRPRQLNAAGMPTNTGAATGGMGGPRGALGGPSAIYSSASGAGGGPTLPLLQPLTESTVLCEEVAKLSWNTTGTRFVTSHSDSSVHVWALDVTYQQAEPVPLAVLLHGGVMQGAPLGAWPGDGSGDSQSGSAACADAGNSAGGVAGAGSHGVSGGAQCAGPSASATNVPSSRPEQKLRLVVAVRKVSSVYPYHSLNAR